MLGSSFVLKTKQYLIKSMIKDLSVLLVHILNMICGVRY